MLQANKARACCVQPPCKLGLRLGKHVLHGVHCHLSICPSIHQPLTGGPGCLVPCWMLAAGEGAQPTATRRGPGEDQESTAQTGPLGAFLFAGIVSSGNFQNLLQFRIQTGINGGANETQPCDPRPAASPSSPKYLVCRTLKQGLASRAISLGQVRC